MHTSYMSCCTFTNSDQQVGTLIHTMYISGVPIIDECLIISYGKCLINHRGKQKYKFIVGKKRYYKNLCFVFLIVLWLKRRQRIWSPKSKEKILSFRQELNSQLTHSNCWATGTLWQTGSNPLMSLLWYIWWCAFVMLYVKRFFPIIIHNRYLDGSIEFFPVIDCEISADSQH